MKSNYKQLGQFIRQVDVRNSEGKEENLLGVSVQKKFIPSIANTVGTDFKKYKVVKKGQFTYIPDTSRRGDKIGIALLEDYEEGLVSNVYTVFEIIDKKQLIPEYLMLWFSRPEFDRYARFKSHGSVREVMDWDEMCKVELPVPSYEKQKEIVDGYKVITERIALKQKINDNLEEAASSIFKSYFVTFEHYGGNIPQNWKQATIGDVVSVSRGASPRPIQDYISQSGMPWVKISDASSSVSKYLFKTAEYIIPEGIQNSRTVTKGMMIVSNSASPGLPMIMEITACVHDGWLIIDDYDCVTQEFMYYHFLNERQSLISSSNGSVFNNLKIDIVKSHPIIIPDEETMTIVTQQFRRLNKVIKQNAREINSLVELQYNLLSKLSNY